MNQHLYAPSTKGYYLRGMHSNIPADAVEVTEEVREQLMAAERTESSAAEMLEAAKADLRTMRRDMLDAVTGIGFRANVAGDSVLAQEAAQVSRQLLDITDDPALNAAQTYDDMRAAGVAAYRRIADGVSPGLRSAFKDLEK